MFEIIQYGLLAGASSVFVQTLFHPLDLIKVRFQSHDGQSRNLVPKYKNIFDALLNIQKHEGIKGLYKGLFISLFAQTLARGSFFGLYENFKVLNKNLPKQQQYLFSSIPSGILTSFFTNPFFVLKTRMFLNIQSHFYKFQITMQINLVATWNKRILQGINNFLFYVRTWGNLTLMLRKFVIIQIVFSLFSLNSIINEGSLPLVWGMIAKFISLSCIYPLTTIKIRIQENQYQSLDKQLNILEYKDQKYTDQIDLVRKMFQKEGFLSFYKGFIINIYRQVPQQGLFFLIYEYLKKQINNKSSAN